MVDQARRARPRVARTRLIIRTTGVLLAVLALGHFAVTHLVNDVAETGSSFITRRWSSALWVTWDGLLLVAALAHVGAASAAVVRDYWPGGGGRRRVLTGVRALLLLLLLAGAVTLVVSAR